MTFCFKSQAFERLNIPVFRIVSNLQIFKFFNFQVCSHLNFQTAPGFPNSRILAFFNFQAPKFSNLKIIQHPNFPTHKSSDHKTLEYSGFLISKFLRIPAFQLFVNQISSHFKRDTHEGYAFTIIIIKMIHFWGTPQVTVFSLEKHIGYRWKEWPRDETWYIQFTFSFFTRYRSIRFHTAGTFSPKYFPVWLRNGVDMDKHAKETVREQEMKKSADKYSNVFYDMLTNVPSWFGLFG